MARTHRPLGLMPNATLPELLKFASFLLVYLLGVSKLLKVPPNYFLVKTNHYKPSELPKSTDNYT